MTEKQPYIAKSLGGKEPGQIRGGNFRIRSRQAEDGSFIQPTDDARKSLETMLRKSGSVLTPIEEALRRLDEGPENELIEVSPGLEVIKWRIEEIQLDFRESKLMSPLVPLKTAFEFIACHLGTAVYNDEPQFCELRRVLYERTEEHPCFRVERLNASTYDALHGICFESNNPHAQVLIRLFGWLVFRVHFTRLAVDSPRFVYTHDLATNTEDVRLLEAATPC